MVGGRYSLLTEILGQSDPFPACPYDLMG